MAIEALRTRPEFMAFRRIPTHIHRMPNGAPLAVAQGGLILGEAAFAAPPTLALYLRFGLELAWLGRRAGVAAASAALAAARAAALFILAEAELEREDARLPFWVVPMAGDAPPPPERLSAISRILPGPPADAAEIDAIRRLWSHLGSADSLMETGGDIRLQRDPRTALNGYGCSHRPRPWAVTFASSTASSSSERGYLAADQARLRTTAALLAQGTRAPVLRALAEVRRGLAGIYGLPSEAAVVLAASGTDTELLALALTHLRGDDAPVLNLLIAPEETGRGVPMAARGVHFAVDTALGHAVSCEAPIAGFRPDTELAAIALRDRQGQLREPDAVEAEIRRIVADGIEAGKRIVVHVLDLSKTGLLAPRPRFLADLRQCHGEAFDIVVDACQARLSPVSVRAYLQLDAVVLITGSKFFTGPPFSGALLIPPAVARRLERERLPAGLAAYCGRGEFPAGAAAAAPLPPIGNYGLSLRWAAALAEMRAFFRVLPPLRADILKAFAAVVASALSANPALTLLPARAILREADEAWEREPSIFSFSLRAPHDPGRYLTPDEARAVYLWLNADLSPLLPRHPAAARICHIGQPVRLPQPGVAAGMGVLRVSAGARLISGEPSHRGLAQPRRIRRELEDLRTVFEKIGLILRHWPLLQAADPMPRYRPATRMHIAVP